MRVVTIAVCGASLAVAALAGCAGEKAGEKKSEGTSAGAASGSMSASAGAGTAKVTIDGQPQEVKGQVVCASAGGNFNIGVGDATTGIAVVMNEDGSKVTSVGLGNVNGIALGYQAGAPGGSATATKDGKSYTIAGTATGVDMANPMQPVTKPFEIAVTCP